MTSKTTIDQLPLDISTRYAQDQKQLVLPLIKDIKDSREVSAKTQISVFTPSVSSLLESLTGNLSIHSTLASFNPPRESIGFLVFTYLLVPSIGSNDKLEALLQKVEEMRKMDKDEEQEGNQEESSEDEESEEKESVLQLFKTLTFLNKCLCDANAKRNQFQQG